MTPDHALSILTKVRENEPELRELVSKVEQARFVRSYSTAQKDSLTKLRGLAQAQLEYEVVLELLEKVAKAIATDYKELTETIIPELMDELSIPSIALSETQELSVATKISASLSKERAPEGCEWLRQHGHGSLIRHEVTTAFDTKQGELAGKVVAALKEQFELEPEVKQTVNHMTLSAWVRGQLAEGEEIPLELFGVYRRRAAVVKTKK